MNKNQRIVLFATAGILLLMLLFPPFEHSLRHESIGYSCIASPPRGHLPSVDIGTLFMQCLIVGAAGAICFFAFKNGKESPEKKGDDGGECKEEDNT